MDILYRVRYNMSSDCLVFMRNKYNAITRPGVMLTPGLVQYICFTKVVPDLSPCKRLQAQHIDNNDQNRHDILKDRLHP